jgi:hypothetical protein
MINRMLSTNFLYLVPLINLAGSGKYAYDVSRGRVQPNRVTWLLWALAPLIAFAAEIGQGVGLQSILTFTVGFGPVIVLAASFANNKSIWHLTRFDILCGTLSLLGLCLWLITRHGDLAIIFSIAADALAALPTVVKSWSRPRTESYLVYLAAAISSALTLLTIDRWTFASFGFPLYVGLMCLLLFTLIRFEAGVRIRAAR